MFEIETFNERFEIDNSDAAFIVAMGEAVGQAGRDHVYRQQGNDGCLYVHTDDEGNLCDGCLIGKALHLLGVPREWLDFHNANQGAYSLMSLLEFSEEIKNAAHGAQSKQDNGETWGVALKTFLYYYNNEQTND